MPKMDKQYQLILGTFIDDEFVWHDVDSFDNLEEGYRAFKKYVNSQLKYTDEELIKVWNTGRLDVELRRGNKLLNWVGIYAREVAQEAKEDEDEKADVKDSVERLFEDEQGELVTESELREEFEQMQADQGPSGFNYSFEEYVKYKTGRHGTLKQIRDAQPLTFTRQQYRIVTEGLKEQKSDSNITNTDIARAAGVTPKIVELIKFRWQFIPEDKIPFVKESDDIPSPDWHHVRREQQELAEAVKAEAKLDKNKTRVGRKFGLTLSQVNAILGK